jgi:hypothetical protein
LKNRPARLATAASLICASSWLVGRVMFALAAPPPSWEARTWLADVSFGRRGLNPCSGVRVDERTVATAAHCVEPPTAFVRTRADEAFVQARVADFFVELDLALVQRAPYASESRFPASRPHLTWLQRALGAQLWIVLRSGVHAARLVEIDDRFVTVETTAPLCYGDSGSPLLAVTPIATELLGVLSTGHPDCKIGAPARFARLDGDRRSRILSSETGGASSAQ